jgi:hypothetical protein
MAGVRDVPVHTNRKYGVTEERTIKNAVYCMELTFHSRLEFLLPSIHSIIQKTFAYFVLVYFTQSVSQLFGEAVTSRKQANQVSLPGTYDLTQRN